MRPKWRTGCSLLNYGPRGFVSKKIRKNLKRKKFYIKKYKKVDFFLILIRVYYIQYSITFFLDEIFLSPFGTVCGVPRTTPNSDV